MAVVTASRDGKVGEIRVCVGDTVRINQEILSIDSPDLTTLILAGDQGTIESVTVKAGDSVNIGQILAWIEKKS